jgi:polysaccharide export outer membrane protein
MKNKIFRKIVIAFLIFIGIINLPLYLFAESFSEKEYIIGSGDVLNIDVWGNDDLNHAVEVSPEGSFSFPLIGKVRAGGLSVLNLETLIKEKLSDGYLVNPKVTVTVSKYQSQKVSILGEVKRPGTYVIKGKTYILELISEAGGFTEMADHTVTIARPKSLKLNNIKEPDENKGNEIIKVNIDGSLDERFFVINKDTIYVNKAPRIFVTGEVKKPGEYKWEKGLTVRQAISLAGGPTDRGSSNRIKVIRTQNGEEKEVKPGLSDAVMPDDIINIPQSYF